MERSLECSREEEVELCRSTKKVKESLCDDSQQHPLYGFNARAMESESESEVDVLRQGVAAVCLARDIIHCIRAPWSNYPLYYKQSACCGCLIT